MRVVCAYCAKPMPDKEPLDDDSLSHGMCDECLDEYPRRWLGVSMSEYVEGFALPVMVVGRERVVIGTNSKAAAILGKTTDQTRGILGGDVMECAYSKLPGGCGQTVHCTACTVRRAVNKAMSTCQGETSVSAYVETVNGRVFMVISTYYEDTEEPLVRIEVEEATPAPV